MLPRFVQGRYESAKGRHRRLDGQHSQAALHGTRGEGAVDQIWRQTVYAEAACAQDRCHGAPLWGIVKMFDKLPHGLVARRAIALGSPRGLCAPPWPRTACHGS